MDVKRGVIEERSYGRFLLYTFFFPIMPAGPIERYGTIDKQSRSLEGFRWDLVQEGVPRILWGLFKKIVLGDSISFLADGLSDPGADCLEYWVAMYAATMKIYLDFSAYTDIAVGTARLCGYRIMENFNNPYFQRNLSLFWKSWHISLTRWFIDYLFIPLGGQPQRLRENGSQHGHRLGRHRNMARSRLAFLVLGALSRSGAHCVAAV
ncbi:MAG: MBOAT family O-acyltransferase [Desulfotomaculales bacterium]